MDEAKKDMRHVVTRIIIGWEPTPSSDDELRDTLVDWLMSDAHGQLLIAKAALRLKQAADYERDHTLVIAKVSHDARLRLSEKASRGFNLSGPNRDTLWNMSRAGKHIFAPSSPVEG